MEIKKKILKMNRQINYRCCSTSFFLSFLITFYLNKGKERRETERIHVFPSTPRQNELLRRKATLALRPRKRRFQTTIRASLGNCVVSNPTTPSPPLSFSFCLISLSLIWWWLSIFRRKLGVQVQPHIFPSFPLNITTHKPHKK